MKNKIKMWFINQKRKNIVKRNATKEDYKEWKIFIKENK